MTAFVFLILSVLFAQQPSDVPPVVQSDIAQTEDALTATQFVWDVTDIRDPFKPYKSPRALKQDAAAPVDPLTLLDLGQVQVLAILWNNKIPRAVLRSSDRKLYTVFRKTRLGTNGGIVVDIREGEVIVVESFDDGFGNIVKEVRALRLLKPSANVSSNPTGE